MTEDILLQNAKEHQFSDRELQDFCLLPWYRAIICFWVPSSRHIHMKVRGDGMMMGDGIMFATFTFVRNIWNLDFKQLSTFCFSCSPTRPFPRPVHIFPAPFSPRPPTPSSFTPSPLPYWLLHWLTSSVRHLVSVWTQPSAVVRLSHKHWQYCICGS